jgi:hypothetical protein
MMGPICRSAATALHRLGHTSSWKRQDRGWRGTRSALGERAGRHQPGFQIAPQSHNQLAGQGNHHDPPDPPLDRADPLLDPLGQGAVWRVANPHPGHFQGRRSSPRIAGLADPLIVIDPTTLRRAWGQPDRTGDRTTVSEVSIENFPIQHARQRGTNPCQLLQETNLPLGLGLRSRLEAGIALCLNGFNHVQDQVKALAFPPPFRTQVRRARGSIATAQPSKLLLPIRAHRVEIPEPLGG